MIYESEALIKWFKACLHLQLVDFLLLADVNELIDSECSEYMISHLNISN